MRETLPGYEGGLIIAGRERLQISAMQMIQCLIYRTASRDLQELVEAFVVLSRMSETGYVDVDNELQELYSRKEQKSAQRYPQSADPRMKRPRDDQRRANPQPSSLLFTATTAPGECRSTGILFHKFIYRSMDELRFTLEFNQTSKII